MELTGEQFERFKEALLSAFPSQHDLADMVRVQLDENLAEIAGGENLGQVVSNLITWAEAGGRIKELIEKAHKYNPGNEKLKEFVSKFESLAKKDLLSKQISTIWTQGILLNVPRLPTYFTSRQADLDELKRKLFCKDHNKIGLTGATESAVRQLGLHGMAGIGKSVLAAALACDPEVRNAFPDGIVWITLGQSPEIERCQANLAEAFSSQRPLIDNVDAGRIKLGKILAKKTALIILDDVWEADDALAFDALGENCRLLITTRNSRLIWDVGANECSLNLLSEEQALDLLARASGETIDTLSEKAREVVQECGYLPLAIATVGAMVHSLSDPWALALKRLEELKLVGIPVVLRAIQVSIEALDQDLQECYLDFAVFPEDTPIPETVFQTLWKQRDINELDIKIRLQTLFERSLLFRDEQNCYTLHDLLYDYVKGQTQDQRALHQRFIDAYADQCSEGWPTGPNDGYYFQYLPYHLIRAGQTEELHELLCNPTWLEKKLEYTDVYYLIKDIADADEKGISLEEISASLVKVFEKHPEEPFWLHLRSALRQFFGLYRTWPFPLRICLEASTAPDVMLFIGNTRDMEGNYALAEKVFRKMVKMTEDDPKAHSNAFVRLATVLEHQNRVQEALEVLEYHLSQPNAEKRYAMGYWWIQYHRGILLSDLHRKLEARELFNRVRENAKKEGRIINALHQLGVLHIELDKLKEAECFLNDCLKRRQKCFVLTESSFQRLEEDGIPVTILNSLKKLLNKEFWTKEALMKAVQNEIEEEQIAKYKELILRHIEPCKCKKEHRWAYDYHRLGQIYALTDRFDEAKKSFEEALAISTEFDHERYVNITQKTIIAFTKIPIELMKRQPESISIFQLIDQFKSELTKLKLFDYQFKIDASLLTNSFRVLGKQKLLYLEVIDADSAKPIGEVARWDIVHSKGKWHATVIVLVIDEQNHLALQERGEGDSKGRWDVSVSGHQDPGETDQLAAIRETWEELGIYINPDQLQRIGEPYQFCKKGHPSVTQDRHERAYSYIYCTPKTNNERTSVFIIRVSEEQKKQIDINSTKDVKAIKWLSLLEAEEEAKAKPEQYASAFKQLLHREIIREINRIITSKVV